jgi:nifR3 family TIM-barrel protein
MAKAGNDSLIERLLDPAQRPVCAAPLAGWTDPAYRRILRACGARHVWIPFVSSHAICSPGPDRDEYLFDLEKEASHVQIFGNVPQINARAASIIEQRGALSIDFNTGCSVKKVHKGGGGSALLKDLDLLKANLKAIVEAVEIPVSLKTRTGFYSDDCSGIEACRIAQDLGCAFVTLHGRYAKQALDGSADWTPIGSLVRELSIPVVGNGDIEIPEDCARMFDETGCAGVMIGRGIMGDPWLIGDCERYLADGNPRAHRTREETVEIMLRHLSLQIQFEGDIKGVLEFRKHIAKYLRGFPQAAILRNALVRLQDRDEIERMLREFGEGRPPASIVEDSLQIERN